MTPFGHAEAHERLADLALEVGGLDRLGSAADDPLASHVATCEVCTRDVEAWRRTAAMIEVARGSGPERLDLADLAADAPIPAPPGLRAAVAEAIRRVPDAAAIAADRPARSPAPDAAIGTVDEPAAGPRVADRATEPRPRRVARLVLPLVAVLAVVAVGGALLLDQAARLDRAGSETAA
ncbi:MAG TPA: hypothetical protein VFX65_05480, partial [Candidatus Limnocylindrales bacterium]|nr:hypothetical protein [Candidatus Limnocylindrales bacterium]